MIMAQSYRQYGGFFWFGFTSDWFKILYYHFFALYFLISEKRLRSFMAFLYIYPQKGEFH